MFSDKYTGQSIPDGSILLKNHIRGIYIEKHFLQFAV